MNVQGSEHGSGVLTELMFVCSTGRQVRPWARCHGTVRGKFCMYCLYSLVSCGWQAMFTGHLQYVCPD